jgi:Ca2+-binding EF-hand superfamily protein
VNHLALLFLSLACLPLPAAVVVSGGDNGNSDWWREGNTAPWSFGEVDRDRDGKVSQGEMAEARQQYATALKETRASLQAAIDLDQSGKLTRHEAAEGMPRYVSLRERARVLAVAANDKNHDGKITEDESLGLEKRIGAVFVRYGAAVVDADRNKNFSRTEVQSAIQAIRDGKGAMFTICDLSNDGLLSVKETDMAFDLLAAAAGITR